jgi:hypothetical protein
MSHSNHWTEIYKRNNAARWREEDISDLTCEDIPKPHNSVHQFTWSAENPPEYQLIGYTLQTWLKAHAENWLTIAEDRSSLIHYGPSETGDNVMTNGQASFVMDGQLCAYEASIQKDTHRVFSDHDISAVLDKLRDALIHENAVRSRYLQFYPSGHDLDFHVRPTPNVSLDEVIIPPSMLEDIIDNTLGHLEHIDGANGVIFYGPPGTGKSLTTQALAAEAMRKGYCAAYVAGRIDFEELDDFVQRYLCPGLLILEDIDTFTESRENHQQHGFSDFLQFMSGLFERDQKTVVIATTNHLKFLDNAVATRPVRFNRRYEFAVPETPELSRLFQRFFPDIGANPELVEHCRRLKFSGSHLAEVKRTSRILQIKRQQALEAILPEAIKIVGGEFHEESRRSGF